MGNEEKARAAEQDLAWNNIVDEAGSGFDPYMAINPVKANALRKQPLPRWFVQDQVALRGVQANTILAGEATFALASGGIVADAAVGGPLGVYVWASNSKAVSALLTGIAGYHVYNVATDPEYAGVTMSIDAGTGVSSLYFAADDLIRSGRGLISKSKTACEAMVLRTTLKDVRVPAWHGPAAKAAAWQGSGRYPGVDAWRNTTLPKGTVLAQGAYSEGSPFFVEVKALARSGQNAETFSKFLQVARHPEKGYRPGAMLLILSDDAAAGAAPILANPQYGSGGYMQFYLADPSIAEPVVGVPFLTGR